MTIEPLVDLQGRFMILPLELDEPCATMIRQFSMNSLT